MKFSKTYLLVPFLILFFNLSTFSQKQTQSVLLSLKKTVLLKDLNVLKDLNTSFDVLSMRALGVSDRSSEETTLLSSKIIRLKFPATVNISNVKKAYEDSGIFKYVELDHVIKGNTVPNDPIFDRDQYYHVNKEFNEVEGILGKEDADMDTDLAWDITTGSDKVVLGVLDTGLRLDHEEFAGRLWVNEDEIPNNGIDDDNNGYIDDINGWDFVNRDNIPEDDNSHGSNVTGIAAATGNNGVGMAGMDWNCKIMVLKVLDDKNAGFLSDEIEAVFYAADNGIHVGNMSFGGSDRTEAFQEAVEYAHSKGVLLVASTGNDDKEIPQFPAAYNTVMAVGATHPNDERVTLQNSPGNSWGSNFGDYIDVVAPGSRIFSVRHNMPTSYDFFKSGTSQATPMVAGLACLIKGLDMTKTPDEIREIIQNSAEDQVGNPAEDTPGYDKFYGFGRINAFQALLATQNPNTLKAQFTVSNNLVCEDETVIFTNISTGNPTSFNWNFGEGASPQSATGAGPHEVTYSTGGFKSVRLELENNEGRDSEIKGEIINVGGNRLGDLSGPTLVGVGQTATYSVPEIAGIEEYAWSVPSGATIISGDFTPTIVVQFGNEPSLEGEISVLIFNQCNLEEFKEIIVEVSETAVLSTNDSQIETSSLKVFPNPSTSGIFNLTEISTYSVFDITGRLILKGNGSLIDLGEHAVGVYFLKVNGQTIKLIR